MAILENLLRKETTLKESQEQKYTSPIELQKRELRNLLIHCEQTLIGKEYEFLNILSSFKKREQNSFYVAFTERIPIYDYDKMFADWWYLTKQGKKNVTYPGITKYFALSSGTTEASSKYIPITKDMLKSIRRTSIRQMMTLRKYDLPISIYSKEILALGGSTNLKKNGHYFEGDLSGITTSHIPFWFQQFYKPGKKIAKRNWNEKLIEIVEKAPTWDIGIIAGVPAWLQILIEMIVEKYGVKTIHEIWPNLQVFFHGGVPFQPYKNGFERLLSKPLHYLETYLASEGFLAFQAHPNRKSMQLVLNNGIFYEFIPFNEKNFDETGNLARSIKTLKIDEVEENIDYALLITTNSGAWRYLIGDIIRFVSVEESEIIITGRTKHFMSLCGEHLSLENMNKAIELIEADANICVREFTLLGEPYENFFAHHWYIGSDDSIDLEKFKKKLDQYIMTLNDDYKVERSAALKKIEVRVLPPKVFYEWMELQGKVGSQNKFPRVLKEEKAQNWKKFLQSKELIVQSPSFNQILK